MVLLQSSDDTLKGSLAKKRENILVMTFKMNYFRLWPIELYETS